jgi:hypothetical protein
VVSLIGQRAVMTIKNLRSELQFGCTMRGGCWPSLPARRPTARPGAAGFGDGSDGVLIRRHGEGQNETGIDVEAKFN